MKYTIDNINPFFTQFVSNPIFPIPINLKEEYNSRWSNIEFSKSEIDNFLNKIFKPSVNVQPNKTIYCAVTKISQDKLRSAGFKITRDPLKADYILADNPYEKEVWSRFKQADKIYFYAKYITEKIMPFCEIVNQVQKNITAEFITVENIYKYLYKYEGTAELADTIEELLKSYNKDNVILAMETMTNANWENNKLYIAMLFNKYLSTMKDSSYYTSISFKGFTESLDFNWKSLRLMDPDDHRSFCSTEEHHNYVFEKYKEELKWELQRVSTKYKIQFTDIQMKIDPRQEILENEENRIKILSNTRAVPDISNNIESQEA